MVNSECFVVALLAALLAMYCRSPGSRHCPVRSQHRIKFVILALALALQWPFRARAAVASCLLWRYIDVAWFIELPGLWAAWLTG